MVSITFSTEIELGEKFESCVMSLSFTPSGKTLKGKEREKFELDRTKIDLKLAGLRRS